MTPARNLTRRSLIALGGAGTVVTLAACAPGDAAPAPEAGTPDGAPQELAKLANIPVGGAISATLAGAPILLAQPSAGTVAAFSAVCPHQGCVVAPASEEFACPCHGSQFDFATGDVIDGPASRALDTVSVAVVGDAVVST